MKILKKSVFLILCLSLTFVFVACEKKASQDTKTAKTEEGKQETEQTEETKAVTGAEIAYSFGVILAKTVKDGKLDFEADELLKGYKAALSKDFTNEDFMKAESLLQRAFQEAQIKIMAENLNKSNKFLEENKAKDGVKVTESGLQYRILKQGDLKRKPRQGDLVKVRYVGRLMDGTIFDENLKAKEAQEIDPARVIPGWQEGLKLMSTGAKFQFFIPPNLAYGERGISQGANVIIPPNEVLIFEIELVSIDLGGAVKDNASETE